MDMHGRRKNCKEKYRDYYPNAVSKPSIFNGFAPLERQKILFRFFSHPTKEARVFFIFSRQFVHGYEDRKINFVSHDLFLWLCFWRFWFRWFRLGWPWLRLRSRFFFPRSPSL